MFQQIRTSKFTRILCIYLIMMIFLETVQPYAAYALTDGPKQPEFASFTPIGTSDMVDLSSGDFNYNIPIMDVGGYPINLAYNSGVTMDQEASWVGLGWNLNIGQIDRNVRGLPDDFRGDEIETINNLKDNVTVSTTAYVNVSVIGIADNPYNKVGLDAGSGIELKYNNYTGLSANPIIGVSANYNDNVSLGLKLNLSEEDGASISPSAGLHGKSKEVDNNSNYLSGGLNAGFTYNSRQSLQNFNLSHHGSVASGKTEKFGTGISGGSRYSLSNDVNYTPNKKIAFENNQYGISLSFGGNIWGVSGEISINGSATIQRLKNKEQRERAFGYENIDLASDENLLDFNRENDFNTITPRTNTLPVTSLTHDILNVQSQSFGGQIRPYRSKPGLVFDAYVADDSKSHNYSGEVTAASAVHGGVALRTVTGTNYVGPWKTSVYSQLKQRQNNGLKYENTYYKVVGELKADPEGEGLLLTQFGYKNPVALKLSNGNVVNNYKVKFLSGYNSLLNQLPRFSSQSITRKNRELRNTVIQKVTKREALNYSLYNGKFINTNINARNHHTAAYIITDKSGVKTIFGETAYNTEKKEVSFATASSQIDCERGTVNYINGENSKNNKSGIDHYFNSVKTGPYAYTYLITSVLSPDYQDIDNNGPTDSDLGSYTKFIYDDYTPSNGYKWRIPFKLREASFNEGLKTSNTDQKGSYIYGKKELKYIRRIETKTHIALFDLGQRKDGHGVTDENGGLGNNSVMYRLEKIRLYAKKPGIPFNEENPESSGYVPIKTAVFEYNYELCPNIDNYDTQSGSGEVRGKLTLTKVYFTYQNSNLGKYTPYEFVYSNSHNYEYNPKNYDIWGNYKVKQNPNDCNSLSNQEFPYVGQNSQLQEEYAKAWSLTEIKLPSGGKIKIAMEADDYQYVQNKKAMRMFKVKGVTEAINDPVQESLYNDNNDYDAKYIVIENNDIEGNDEQIIQKYTEGLVGKPVYFSFFLNMTNSKRDHVEGFFEIDSGTPIVYNNQSRLLYLPMKKLHRDGSTGPLINPISVSGWFFGQKNLYREVYGLPAFNPGIPNPVDVAESLIGSFGSLLTIFTEPNQILKNKERAKSFVADKSWIRLNEPTGRKIGGGSRVKTVEIFDEWKSMLEEEANVLDENRFNKKYGQEYSYNLDDGVSSSGVATFEPNVSKENPFVVPLYNNADKLRGKTYSELPFGASLYPAARVTYRQVSVKNITAADDDESGQETRKTRSGKVVTKHYTSYDFPTKSDYTSLDQSKDFISTGKLGLKSVLKSLFGARLDVRSELYATQGFQIEMNDMDGKVKSQEVFDNGGNSISSVEYIYNTSSSDPTELNSKVQTIDENGTVSVKAIGEEFDIVNDLKINYNKSETKGRNANVDYMQIGPFPVIIGTVFFDRELQLQTLRAATTTKVVRRTGILVETIATNSGAEVHTKNLAWDANTGEVLLTETSSEYKQDFTYQLKYPAYWYYNNMKHATNNIDVGGLLVAPSTSSSTSPNPYFTLAGQPNNIDKIFTIGDELQVANPIGGFGTNWKRAWIYGFNGNKTGVLLIDKDGNYINACQLNETFLMFKVIKSGYRNNVLAEMATLTLMTNPIVNNRIKDFQYLGTSNQSNPLVLQASAIEYKDTWPFAKIIANKRFPEETIPKLNISPENFGYPFNLGFNPFLYNVKGNWRPNKSYAFLTGRASSGPQYSTSNPRHSGFFSSFESFYQYNTVAKKWFVKQNDRWRNASEVTKFNPFGAEIENRDALNRYSSAQYNDYRALPLAIASNSKYTNMATEDFEDVQPSDGNNIEDVNRFNFDRYSTEFLNNKAHTGRKSNRVQGGTTATLYKLSPFSPAEVQCGNSPSVDCSQNLNDFANSSATINNPTVTLLNTGNNNQTSRKYIISVTFSDPDGSNASNPVINLCQEGLSFTTINHSAGVTTLSLQYTTENITATEFVRINVIYTDCEGDILRVNSKIRLNNTNGTFQTASAAQIDNNCNAIF